MDQPNSTSNKGKNAEERFFSLFGHWERNALLPKGVIRARPAKPKEDRKGIDAVVYFEGATMTLQIKASMNQLAKHLTGKRAHIPALVVAPSDSDETVRRNFDAIVQKWKRRRDLIIDVR